MMLDTLAPGILADFADRAAIPLGLSLGRRAVAFVN